MPPDGRSATTQLGVQGMVGEGHLCHGVQGFEQIFYQSISSATSLPHSFSMVGYMYITAKLFQKKLGASMPDPVEPRELAHNLAKS
ncbi:hypothetical protein [Leptolyngbya sp. PCC 6406]|uniref:hypothetical protein n=1 Tax=Leptolyngbya sp. PCC 6406 TaxID=1173264 RepID=UPI0012DDB2CE|nr:hypothetical protein [Leptolyngbya sp. PCC 6406]